MRAGILLALAMLPACASSGSTAAAPTRPATQTISSPDMGSLTMSTTNAVDVVTVPFAPDAVWRIMPSVYDSLGVPVTLLDQNLKQIGNKAFKTRQKLGKTSMSRFLDCGQTQIGQNADSYEVILGVTTSVSPGKMANTAVLTTVVDAQAKPITFNQAYNRCSSKGTIEKRLSDIVTAKLAAK